MTPILAWGSNGDDVGELNFPRRFAFDGKGHIYVAEQLNHRIQKFTTDGQPLGIFGSFGLANNELFMPIGITVDNRDRIIVGSPQGLKIFSDEGVQVASASLATSGEMGGEKNKLFCPVNIVAGPNGTQYVISPFLNNVKMIWLW